MSDNYHLNLLSNLTESGGSVAFPKDIMFEWMKGRHITFEEVNNVNQYSLFFLPIEAGCANSFIEIHGDNRLYDECTDYHIYSLIFKSKPKFIYHYNENETVAFFKFQLDHFNIIITCDSLDDRPYWFFNQQLEFVETLFERPNYIST